MQLLMKQVGHWREKWLMDMMMVVGVMVKSDCCRPVVCSDGRCYFSGAAAVADVVIGIADIVGGSSGCCTQ